MAKKELTPRIARWALQLEDYDYKIEHRPGTSMRHVDALSRNPCVMLLNDNLLHRIQSAQRKDEMVRAIVETLKHAKFEDYLLEKEVLFKVKGGKKLLYVPKAMQAEIIRNVHEQGHFSIRKVEEIIERDYFIPKLRNKITTCVRNCVRCILAGKEGKKEGFLHPIPKGTIPLQTYHLDHLGPMTATNKNYRYIFTIIDAFTKFIWLYPTRTTSSAEVLAKLKQQQSVFGNPGCVITDRGPAFTSNAFQDFCKSEGIECIQITTGVPRGNGQVERVHKIVKSALSKLSMEKTDDWYKFTDKLQRFLNNSISRSTGKTPFELLFGTKMRNREDSRLAETIQREIVQVFNDERDEIRESAARQIAKVQDENRRGFNKKRRMAAEYKVGDIVAIKRTQFGTGLKIAPKYLGPYEVVRVKKNERYDVTKVGDHEGPVNTSTCAEYMRPFTHSESDQDEETDVTDTEDPCQDETHRKEPTNTI